MIEQPPRSPSFESLPTADFAEKVRKFWRLHGYIHVSAYAVQTIPGELNPKGQQAVWGVRSNLVNGLPPGVSGNDVAGLYRRERRFG